MKKQILSFALAVLLACSAFSLSACGGSSFQVPDGELQLYVENTLRKESANRTSFHWDAVHQPDSELHRDIVTLTVDLESTYVTRSFTATVTYQYDRTTDLWSLVDESKWHLTGFALKDSLLGRWEYDGDGTGYINVTEVSGTRLTLDYELSFAPASVGFTAPPDAVLHFNGSATVGDDHAPSGLDDQREMFTFYVDLPQGYRYSTSSGGGDSPMPISFFLDFGEGISTFLGVRVIYDP
ncbi:MAG: hypothetical protein II790_05840 [Schwartzia sp.]|nr:hypothetical protein [Schwartzia sp. (in: firmicutes)]